MLSERQIKRGLTEAVRCFWGTRDLQARKQQDAGRSDQGTRGAVTGGKQMDGFVSLVCDLIRNAGMPAECLHTSKNLELPGFFRSEKKWDLLVVDGGTLVAAVEFKSQIGPSFGNNFNNRTEEAVGTALDMWTAFREGAFAVSERPWLGYLMLLEDCPRSTSPISVREPHFPVFREFVYSSYSLRYQLLLTKLVRERLYDSACFLLSSRQGRYRGTHAFPNVDLEFLKFAASLYARVVMHVSARRGKK